MRLDAIVKPRKSKRSSAKPNVATSEAMACEQEDLISSTRIFFVGR